MSALSSQESVLLIVSLAPRTVPGKEQVLNKYLWKMTVTLMMVVVMMVMVMVMVTMMVVMNLVVGQE